MKQTRWPLAALLIVTWSAVAIAADKTNFVILLCDDLGYGDLGCYGNEGIHSPHIDQLADEGMRLTDCYSAAPVCSPSRGGLLTGRIPQRLGIRQWIAPGSGIFLRPDETTIAQLLQQSGYRTCHAGKWHVNSETDGSERTPGEAGFDHWLYTQNNSRPGHRGPENFVRNGEPAGKIAGPSSHIVVDEAIAFLEAHPGEPFFLNLWFHETHEPVVAAPRFLDLYPDEPNLDRRHYLADVTQMDAAVGKLLAYLDEHGLRDNTLVFFSSDNGPETLNIYPSAKRCYGSAGPLRGRKLQVTEGGYRVPGILRWPGHVAAGTVLSEPVCSVDLLPTYCAIAGVGLPAEKPLDGVDIGPLLAGGKIDRPHPLYWQYDFSIDDTWNVALRDGPWKLLADAALERFELYNLVDDVAESHDASAAEPERLAAMTAELKRLHAEVNAEGATSGNPPPQQR